MTAENIIKRLQDKQGLPKKKEIIEKAVDRTLPDGKVLVKCEECETTFLTDAPPKTTSPYDMLRWVDDNRFCKACSEHPATPTEIKSMVNRSWDGGRRYLKHHDDYLIGSKKGPPVDADGKQLDPRKKND